MEDLEIVGAERMLEEMRYPGVWIRVCALDLGEGPMLEEEGG